MEVISEIRKMDSEMNKRTIAPALITSVLDISLLCIRPDSIEGTILYILLFLSVNASAFGVVDKMLKGEIPERINRINELLRSSERYQELSYEYDLLIADIASYLKSKGLKSSKKAVLYLNDMMKNGYLSYSNAFVYGNFIYNYDFLYELLGSLVTTGIAVCRHQASFVTDVINKYGYESYSVVVDQLKKFDLPVSILEKLPTTGHVLSGIVDEDGKYCYDPTKKSFVNPFSDNNDMLVSINKGTLYRIDKDDEIRYNAKIGEKYDELSALPFETLDNKELEELSSDMEEFCKNNSKENEEFHNDIKPRLDKVFVLSKDMLPRTNTKMLSWNLK